MVIEARDHWIEDITSALDDHTLCEMFEEVVEFRKSGVLKKESKLRGLSRQFEEHTHVDNGWLRQAEDAVLYEMSRRYHNSLES